MEANINSAIQKGFFQQIRFLLEFGHETNVRDAGRRTPLINCAFIEDETWGVGIARMLLEHDARIGLKDKMGLNAFHYACIYERIELVKVYLSAIDFDINAADKQGNTALHHVVTNGNQDLLKLLIDALKRYKTSVDKANKKGITPLIHAYKNGKLTCADILVQLGQASKDARDLVEFKSAYEWEEEAMLAKELEAERKENERVKRPRTAFARLQTPSPPNYQNNGRGRVNGRLTRVPSAPLLTRRHSSSNIDKENEDDEIIQRNKINPKLFRSASASDLRNKPEYILNISPLHCFTADKHVNYLARHGQFVQQEDGSWRFEMKSLYNKFEFQFTNSYRKGAKPPEPGTYLHGLHPMRALSPNPSEADSSKKGGLRRGSVRSPTGSEAGKKSRIGSANPRNRRASLLSAAPTSSRSLLTNTDSSSNESVNRLTKQKRKGSGQDFKDDISEASSHSSKSDKSKSPASGGDPGRPVSRTANHTAAKKEGPVSANNNLAAIKE